MSSSLIKENFNGLQVSSLKEGGFNSANFTGTYIDAFEKAIPHAKETALTLTKTPNLKDEEGVKIGGTFGSNGLIEKGVFCEKPITLPASEKNSIFYPLDCCGSNSQSLNPARGFNTYEYSIGGKTTKGINSSSITTESITNIEDFDTADPQYENYPVDKNYLCNYNGIYPTDDTVGINNLLKFPQNSVDVITGTAVKGTIFSTKIPGYDTILDLSVTVNDSTKTKEDYILSPHGGFSLISSEESGTVSITVYRHNRWAKIWSEGDGNANIIEQVFNNPVHANDAIKLTLANTKYNCTFSQSVTIPSAGFYCFSAWCRLDSAKVTDKTYITGLTFTPKNSSTAITPKYVVCDTKRSSTDSTLNVSTMWNRYAKVSYLEAGEYNATIIWPASAIQAFSNNIASIYLKFAGLLVEKAAGPSTYNYKKISYTAFPVKRSSEIHPLLFNFPQSLEDSTWTIVYSRYIFDHSSSGLEHYDSIGDTYFGYKGSDIIVNGNKITPADTSLTSSDFYNRWERVFLTHKAGEASISMTVTSQGIDSTNPEKEYNTTISIESASLSKSLYGVNFQLGLGSRYIDSKFKIYHANYKNVWWFPYIMDEDEKFKFLNPPLEINDCISETRKTLNDGTVKTSEDKNVVIKSVYLEEAND
jgi:hypothetical protein